MATTNDGINDELYLLFYNLETLSLKEENVYDGICKGLFFMKIFLNCGDCILFKKDPRLGYVHFTNQVNMTNSFAAINKYLNLFSNVIEVKESYGLELNVDDAARSVIYTYLHTEENEYVFAISDLDISRIDYNLFHGLIKESFGIILNRLEWYDKIYIDGLTGLSNRLAYNKKIEEIESSDKKCIYAIFDLFRLKYINDNYGHLVGDKYISSGARILDRQYPKYQYVKDHTGSLKKEGTGHYLYRLGGDEFALFTDSTKDSLIASKAKLAANELQVTDLGIRGDTFLGLNYGMAVRENSESVMTLSYRADQKLKLDKDKMYKKYGFDRRS